MEEISSELEATRKQMTEQNEQIHVKEEQLRKEMSDMKTKVLI